MKFFVPFALLLLSTIVHSNAVTLASNLGEAPTIGWSTGFDKALSFTTDGTASSQVIRSFSTFAAQPSDPSTYSIGIWSNSGSSPGSLIAGTSFAFHDYNSSTKKMRFSNSGFSLANNTTYWIVVDEFNLPGGGLEIGGTLSSNQVGWALGNSTSWRFANTTGPWYTDTTIFAELSTDAVPEPSVFSLIAIGLGGLAALRRRKTD